MKKESLGNMKRFLAVLLTVVLMGSSLQPAREVFANEEVTSGTEQTVTTPETESTITDAASGGALAVESEEIVTEQFGLDTIELSAVETSAFPIGFFGLSDGVVTLKSGNYVDWIERIDLSSDTEGVIRSLYDTLVEGSDNDGINDILIENSTNDIIVISASIPVEGTFSSEEAMNNAAELVANEENAKYVKYIRATFDAFDRDHPEVFWMNGSTSSGCSYNRKATKKLIRMVE